MIDLNARNRLLNDKSQKQLQDGLSNVTEAIKSGNSSQPVIELLINQITQLNGKFEAQMVEKIKVLNEAFKKNEVSTEQLQSLKALIESVNSKLAVFEEIKQKIEAGQTIVLPDETKVSGEVSVSEVKKLPPITVSNFPKLEFPESLPFPTKIDIGSVQNLPPVTISNLKELNTLITSLQATTIQAIQALKVNLPGSFKISDEVKINDFDSLLDGIEELKKGFNILIKLNQASQGKGVDADKPMKVEITKGMITNPVTNVSINSLSGFIHTTAATVTTTLTPLPTYGVLANRRSMIIYNNGSATIYIGGSDVTAANGLPIPAGTYSPPLDNGVRTLLYGVTASSTSDVRVMEISDIATGR